MNQSKPVYIGGTRRVPAAPAPLRLQDAPQHARRNCAKSSPSAAGERSSPSRPATRCTARTTSSRSAPQRKRKAQPARPPGRRHDQAGRRRPLHARPLLPGAHAALPAEHGHALAAAARDADGRPARSDLARASSARTTAARTSSSAATTPAPARTQSGKPFYGPYDAQELMQKHEEELGMKMVDFKQMVYVPDEDKYYPGRRSAQGQEDDWTSPAPSCATGSPSAPRSPTGSRTRAW